MSFIGMQEYLKDKDAVEEKPQEKIEKAPETEIDDEIVIEEELPVEDQPAEESDSEDDIEIIDMNNQSSSANDF